MKANAAILPLLVSIFVFPVSQARGDSAGGEGDAHVSMAALAASATIGIYQALETASGIVSGTVVEAALLEEEEGKPVWEVKFVNADGEEVEVQVDAQTGIVLGEEEESCGY